MHDDRFKSTIDGIVAFFLASVSLTSVVAALNSILTTGVLLLNIWFLIGKLRERKSDSKDNGKTLILVTLCASLTGCGTLIPSERAQSAAVKSAENLGTQNALNFKRVIESRPVTQPQYAPPPKTKPSSTGTNLLEMEELAWPLPAMHYRETTEFTDNSQQTAGFKEAVVARKEVQIPEGVKLILLGVGILVVLFALNKVRQSSQAVNAAYQAGDGIAKRLIDRLRSQAMQSTDPVELARINAELAHLETERGKLASTKNGG